MLLDSRLRHTHYLSKFHTRDFRFISHGFDNLGSRTLSLILTTVSDHFFVMVTGK